MGAWVSTGPTLIRWLNPTRSFFLSAQAYGTHYPDSRAGRRGIVSENNNFIFTVFAQNHFMRDQLVYLVFGAFGTAAQDGTTGGNIEYLITNNWVGDTRFLPRFSAHGIATTLARSECSTTGSCYGGLFRPRLLSGTIFGSRLRLVPHAGRWLGAESDERVLGPAALSFSRVCRGRCIHRPPLMPTV